jgi:hypothetical protein
MASRVALCHAHPWCEFDSRFWLFLIAAASSLALWTTGAVTKRHQMRHYVRIREIEVNRYRRSAEDEREYSAPRINWSWFQANLVFTGKGRPKQQVVEFPNRWSRAYIYPFLSFGVALPHLITFAISVVLFLMGCTGLLKGFALGAAK